MGWWGYEDTESDEFLDFVAILGDKIDKTIHSGCGIEKKIAACAALSMIPEMASDLEVISKAVEILKGEENKEFTSRFDNPKMRQMVVNKMITLLERSIEKR